ncbi:MAG: LytTR family transcriptional regulator, partial [Streptococcaceae bacterium]|nr:LytTR family transcriptional regulator [Streptococcaceae bacterium]
QRFLDFDIFHFSFNKKDYSIRYKNIIYFEKSLARVSVLTTDDEGYVLRISMSDLMEKLNQSFVQISRSHVVNAVFIKELKKGQVVLKNGEILPMGRTFEAQAREKILNRLSGEV